MITGSGARRLWQPPSTTISALRISTAAMCCGMWKSPAGGQATPMTYLNSQGEQMVVLVAGGHGSVGTTLGDYVLAYKLEAQ